MVQAPVLRYDAAQAAEMDDPYPWYAQLRAAGPVVPGGPGTWAVTRHADVVALLRDNRLGHQFPDAVYRLSGEPDGLADFFRATVLNRDPPSHTVLRRVMARALSPRLVDALRPRVTALVAELFNGMADAGTADVVAGLAYPLPVTVAAELLGVPVRDRDKVRPHAMALGRAFGAGLPTTKDRGAAVRAVEWLRRYVGDLLREAPAGGALAQILAGASALPRAELIDNIIFLFFAGFDTTTNLISTGCAALLEHPDALDRLRSRPALVPSAVEELLRYDAPIQATTRVTREPVTVGGRQIRKDRLVVLLLGSANRDERQFPDPDRLDLARSPNPHLGFSSGTHHCLGAMLARMEGAAVLHHVARNLADFAAAGPAVRRAHMSFRGYERLPVRVTPR
jgi:cytochrome P450